MKEGGIYIHVPFCKNKCLYCDFYSGGARIVDWSKYTDSLLSEFDRRKEEIDFLPATLYVGGGTPSLMPVKSIERIYTHINNELNNPDWKEVTIEVNPEDVEVEKVELWKKMSIDRVSIGIQTLDYKELKKLGRRHTPEDSIKALNILRRYFGNVSVDLMFGIPGQTVESYKKSLDKILEMEPQHISSYSLMLEEGTALTLLESQNKISLPNEEECIKMYHLTLDRLRNAGYRRYETSNFSKSGFESIHNTNYWLGKPYLGLGPSAHSYDGESIRRANRNDIKGYIKEFEKNLKGNISNFYTEENLSINELREEMVMTRLRMEEGLDLEEFSEKFGEKEKNNLLQQSSPFMQRNLLKEKKGRIYFTEEGFLISDSILSRLI